MLLIHMLKELEILDRVWGSLPSLEFYYEPSDS